MRLHGELGPELGGLVLLVARLGISGTEEVLVAIRIYKIQDARCLFSSGLEVLLWIIMPPSLHGHLVISHMESRPRSSRCLEIPRQAHLALEEGDDPR